MDATEIVGRQVSAVLVARCARLVGAAGRLRLGEEVDAVRAFFGALDHALVAAGASRVGSAQGAERRVRRVVLLIFARGQGR